ncbi:hypothetical protein G6F62_014937 [Rhizopus arrhizus]|nr:hypothetical protein G6F62_014937 [Rhizopus arrhizus]
MLIHVQRGGLASHQAFGQAGAGAQIGRDLVEAGQRARSAARWRTAASAATPPARTDRAGSAAHTAAATPAGRQSATTAGLPAAPTGRSRSPRMPG